MTDNVFHRPPRAFPPLVPQDEIALAAPPTVEGRTRESLIAVILPALGGATMIGFAVAYGNRLFLYIAIGVVVIMILGGLALRWSHQRQGRKTARRKRKRYREYLTVQERRLALVADLQRAAAVRRHPDPQRLPAVVTGREHLWERRPGDADFLTVRTGRAPVAHAARPRVNLGSDPIAEYEPALLEEANALVARWRAVDDVPVAVALTAAPVLSVVGPAERARACVRAQVMQLALAHAPGDLQIAAAHLGRDADWDWLKWLPHARRAAADDASVAPRLALARDVAGLASLLDEHVAPRLEQLRTLGEATSAFGRAPSAIDAPHLVLVIDGFSPLDARSRLALLREALAKGASLCLVLICLVEQSGDEPAETSARLRLAPDGRATLEETGPGGLLQHAVRVDAAALDEAEALARALAPVRLQEHGAASGADAHGGLLGLLGLPSVEALDPAREWAPRPRALALRATIGVTDAGERLELDLKQAAEGGMGPHGLIIGATGSGKSELLRTLVTSLALAHPPDELSFVFVDFKGGAAFADLGALPHTAGMITNLQDDLGLVDRMHDALFGEQERRQRMLRDAGNVDDVIAYRRLRERRPELPALPDLLVVIDEFGELLASRPEFIDLFVAIGRVGRSLGIHLLFASQRFDEGRLRGLESHLRYRICLRTFSAAESKGVLGTADAYVLPSEPGLGYLKVDTGVYERFRAALVAAPRQVATGARRARVVAFGAGAGGQGAAAPRPRQAGAEADGDGVPGGGARGPSDLRQIVERLRAAHGAAGVHQVWCAPLAARVALGAILAPPAFWERRAPAAGLRAAIGTVDLPREQRSEPLVLDFDGTEGHLAVVGAPQSGKSTLLRSMVLALARAHTPEEVQVLGIDFGGGLLRALNDLPHVAAVAGKSDRELVGRIVARAARELETREAAFRSLGLDSMADVDARRLAGEDVPCGRLVLVIDGWAQLKRDYDEFDDAIEELLGRGLTYGIHVIVAASRWAEMRPNISDNLGGRLELRLNDPLDSQIDRKAAARLAAGTPGRGLTRGASEFHAALPLLDDDDDDAGGCACAGRVAAAADSGAALARAVTQIGARWHGAPADPVLVLPRRLMREDLGEGGGGAVFGVEEERLQPLRVELDGPDAHLLVLGDGESGRTNFLRAFVEGVAGAPADDRPQVIVIDPRRTLVDVAGIECVVAHASTQASIVAAIQDLALVVNERAARLEQAPGADPGPPLVLIVDDYDLIATPDANPIAALTAALAYGRDLRLHVVVVRRVAGCMRAAFEPFLQKLFELRPPGLIFSGDATEGPVLDGVRARSLPAGRAQLVRRGQRPVLVQTIFAPPRVRTAAPPPDPTKRHLELAAGGLP